MFTVHWIKISKSHYQAFHKTVITLLEILSNSSETLNKFTIRNVLKTLKFGQKLRDDFLPSGLLPWTVSLQLGNPPPGILNNPLRKVSQLGHINAKTLVADSGLQLIEQSQSVLIDQSLHVVVGDWK